MNPMESRILPIVGIAMPRFASTAALTICPAHRFGIGSKCRKVTFERIKSRDNSFVTYGFCGRCAEELTSELIQNQARVFEAYSRRRSTLELIFF